MKDAKLWLTRSAEQGADFLRRLSDTVAKEARVPLGAEERPKSDLDKLLDKVLEDRRA